MKQRILPLFTLLATFASIDSNAQLTVKGSDSFVYVGDELLFVNQDINLDQGNLYLRKQGQLLQGGTVTTPRNSTNKGLGKLSVFIDSKASDAYNVTQYGIPVGNTNSSAPGSNNIVDLISGNVLYRPVTVGATPQAVTFSSSQHNGAATASSLFISSRFMAWYGGTGGYSDWKYPYRGARDIPAGYGVNFKGTSGSDSEQAGEGTANKASDNAVQRIDFKGLPNDGDITIPVVSGQWYLLGNPYPSAFNLNQFIIDNASLIKAVYFYEEYNSGTHILNQYQAGYGVYTPASGVSVTSVGYYTRPAEYFMTNGSGEVIVGGGGSAPGAGAQIPFGPFLPIGKGFWIETKAGGTLKFANTQRAYIKDTENNFYSGMSSVVSRTTNNVTNENWPKIPNVAGIDYEQFSRKPKPSFAITAKSTTGASNVAFIFDDAALNDYNGIEDAIADLSNDFVMYIPKAANSIMVSGQPFNVDEKIPVSFKSNTNRQLSISANSLEYFNLAEEIYLHDKISDIYLDIKNNVAQINVPSGTTSDQYQITFKRDSQLSNDNEFLNNAFVVLQNNTDKVLTISNPEGLDIQTAEIFDIQGKLILNKKNLGSENQYSFATSGFADGVYIVKVGTKNGKAISKKVVVKN